jgi:hypothetical protein
VRSSSVICRFLSLLDVTLILLGMMMIVIAQAQMRAESAGATSGGLPVAETLYLYAGTFGAERGRVYPLGPDRRPRLDRPVRLDTAEDVRPLWRDPTGPRLILLLVDTTRAFDSMWDDARMTAMEKAWGARIVRVYDWHPPEGRP